MKRLVQTHRVVAMLMLGAFATTLFAPVAEAGNGRGHGRRWKRSPVVCEVRQDYRPHSPRRVVYERRHSDAGPILAGIVGGLVLGAVISNAHASVHTDYWYWDPYCETRYSSLERYRSHSRSCDHPQVVRVIEVSSGNHVRDVCWRDNAWREYSSDWREYGGGHDDHDGRDWDHDGRRYKDDRDWDDD